MALYRQFIIGMMLAFAVWMSVVTALFVANGEAIAVVTLAAALVIRIGALTVVPAKLATSG
jgi:hypothetical protein